MDLVLFNHVWKKSQNPPQHHQKLNSPGFVKMQHHRDQDPLTWKEILSHTPGRPPPKHTKATRASVPPTFTETLLKYSLCTKNYQFPTPFRICIASSSTLSVQCCPGIPGITPQAGHTLQGEAVPLCCQWHTEHWPFIPGLLLISHSENNVHTFPFPRIQWITVPSSKNPGIQFLPKINGKINTT